MLSLALVDEGRRGIDPKIEFRWNESLIFNDTIYTLLFLL